MSVYLSGSYSPRPWPTSVAAVIGRIRRLLIRDGSTSSEWRRPVPFSEWRGVLDTLRDLPKVVTDASLPGSSVTLKSEADS